MKPFEKSLIFRFLHHTHSPELCLDESSFWICYSHKILQTGHTYWCILFQNSLGDLSYCSHRVFLLMLILMLYLQGREPLSILWRCILVRLVILFFFSNSQLKFLVEGVVNLHFVFLMTLISSCRGPDLFHVQIRRANSVQSLF